MAIETMKQVAVRMTPKLHREAIKAAGRARQTFGEFVRSSVSDRIQNMKRKTDGKDETNYDANRSSCK